MNDRIKELALRAGMDHPAMGEIDYSRFSYKKFAELIIKDCFSCCNAAEKIEWPDLASYPPSYEVGVEACKVKIQLHFGVKE